MVCFNEVDALFRRLAVVVFLVLAVRTLPARHLPIQVYTSAHGLPRNTVECMVPTPAGILWLCTMEGLVRFDGYHFRTFGPEQGLPSRTVLDFAAAREGGYWLLTEAGLCRLPANSKIGERCEMLQSQDKAAPFYTGQIFESTDGHTYVTNSNWLFRVAAGGKRLERIPLAIPTSHILNSMADGPNGALLLGTDFALFELHPGGGVRNLSASLGPIGILCFYRWSEDEYWIGTTAGLMRMRLDGDNRKLRLVQLPQVPATGFIRINSILRRRDGTVWVAGNGIMHLDVDRDGEILTAARYTEGDGLPSLAIGNLIEDPQGNLWGSTEGSGIFRVEDSGFVSYSGKDGLGTGRIAAILEDSRGRLCVQTSWDHGPNVLLKVSDSFRQIPIQHPPALHYFGWGWNQNMVAAHDGSWWVPTGQGVLRFPALRRTEELTHATPKVYDERSPFACREAFRGFEAPSGDVWFTCIEPERKVIRWRKQSDTFQTWTVADGLPRDTAPMVFRSGDGDILWMATSSQLIRFRNGRFEVFPLAPGKRLPYVRDMLVDSAGRIWLATQFAGLFRCDNPKDAAPVFRAYTVAEGLSTDFVSSLVEDAAGYIYAGTARGVDRIDPRAPVGSRHIRHFTAADGLPESEQNTAMRDHQGHLWFGTLGGLAELDPGKLQHRPAPDIYLTRVRVRGEEVPLPWQGTRQLSLHLASDRNQVEIEYSAIDLGSPASLLYQYRLQGGPDRDWSEPVPRLDVNYASLPAGRFHFEVRAVDADGQVSQQTAGFDLAIDSPLWRRWWFLSGMATLLTGALILFYDSRVRHLLAMERLRTRIATDLHDDIGASLTQISILSELARRGSAPQVLSDIANIARGLVSDMSDIVWAVNPRHDRFEGLVHRMRRFASDVLGGADIDLRFETSGLPADVAVPLDARRPLYLVLKEAVNNVARHSGAHKASIRLELVDGDLILTVTDDGRGFDSTRTYSGEGLGSMARRMREIGGTATWEPQPGGGTRFTAVFPLPGRTALHELMGLASRIRR